MADRDNRPVDLRDVAAIGARLVEMADRLKIVNKVVPGSMARQAIDIDGTTYMIVMAIRPS